MKRCWHNRNETPEAWKRNKSTLKFMMEVTKEEELWTLDRF